MVRREYRQVRSSEDFPGIRPQVLLDYSDPDYVSPTPSEIKHVLVSIGLSGSKAADLLGVNSRTVRKWTGGEQRMPYSAWKLLLLNVSEEHSE